MHDAKLKNEIVKFVVIIAGLFTTLAVFGIYYFIISDGIGVFSAVSPKEFFFSPFWYPTYSDPEFGILALLIGTLSVTGLTVLISIPLAFVIAIYMGAFSGTTFRGSFKFIFELMAGIPSVVLGSFGLRYVSEWLTDHLPNVWTGLNILNASLMLSILAMPYFITLMEDAIRSIPRDQKEASLALGANLTSTIFRVIIPQAKNGIVNAIILGTNRIIGETMIVLMIAGGSSMIPKSIFDPVRPLTATIAGEMGEVELNSIHYNALFMIGVVILLISTVFTIIVMKLQRNDNNVG
ncbi:MAG: phosphate ABC transporter permease subunit PstC [Kosmotoga sp.]|nr:MAG: phosphate ABC transporter permease subunit PstC [Kosmotoga sp.]